MQDEDRTNAELCEELHQLRQLVTQLEVESDTKLWPVFNAIQEGICVLDLELTITALNEAMARAFDLVDPQSAVGCKCFEVFKHRKNPCPYCVVAEAYRTRAPASRASTSDDLLRTGGRTFEMFAYPIFDAEGKLSGAVEYARDITTRLGIEQSLLESRRQFDELAKTVDEVVWTAALDGSKMLYIDPAAERVYGRRCGDFLKDPELWSKVVHREDREVVKEGARQLLARGKREMEYRIIRPDGQIRWLFDRARVIVDETGKPTALGGIASDITDQRRNEESMRLQRDVAVALNEEVRIEQALELCTKTAIEVSGMDCAGVYLISQEVGMTLAAHSGVSTDFLNRVAHLDADSQAVQTVLAGQPLYFRAEELPPPVRDSAIQEGMLSVAVLPVRHHKKVIACLNMGSHSLADVPIWARSALETVAATTGAAIARINYEESLSVEQRFLRKLLDLQERERKLLAYEIHDGLIQEVVTAKMFLEGALKKLESQKVLEAAELQRAADDLLARAIVEGRRMITELRPMIIDEAGIVAALEHLIAGDFSSPSLAVEFSCSSHFGKLDPMLEGALFRIVQEALTNVKRHSRSDSASVELTHDDGRLRLEIRDRGVGFDPGLVSSERFGLRGIRERARLFGGHATIDSATGKGTRITVDLPATEEVADGTENDRQE